VIARRGGFQSAQAATHRRRHRTLHVYQDADGRVVIRERLEPEVGAVLMQALAAARDLLYRRRKAKDAPAGTRAVDVSAGGADVPAGMSSSTATRGLQCLGDSERASPWATQRLASARHRVASTARAPLV